MIQKDWRNRLRLLKKEKALYIAITASIGMPTLFAGFASGDFLSAFIFSSLLSVSAFFIIYIRRLLPQALKNGRWEMNDAILSLLLECFFVSKKTM